MTNREIASQFKLLAELMELHDENPFRFKSYASAYLTLKKLDADLISMDEEALRNIPGIGKNIGDKIIELRQSDKMQALEDYLAKTPAGLIEVLSIKGLGPKKVRTIWMELGVTDLSELLLACNENRLVEVKGFGIKTQEDIIKKIEFHHNNKGLYHYASVVDSAYQLIHDIKKSYPQAWIEISGGLRKKDPVVTGIEILTTLSIEDIQTCCDKLEDGNEKISYHSFPVTISTINEDRFYSEWVKLSSEKEFLEALPFIDVIGATSESAVFDHHQCAYVIPEYRIGSSQAKQGKEKQLPEFIEDSDVKGVIHNHTTYSDGLHTLKEMVEECRRLGYAYFVVSDHSRSAGYANGLQIERVLQQWREIDEINASLGSDFKVYKGIESDILNDGSLDYPDDILEGFEVVIASIHSNLKMDEAKATSRLITAIENPHTDILGHPTGRLLLGREGYPIDHQKVIDACAANKVVIEINANPLRLDLDWTWIGYALKREVMISIHPDAHSKAQIGLIKYGVNVARKAGVEAKHCLCCHGRSEFEAWLKRR